MAKNNNPGKVDLDRVTKSVLNNGGGVREISYPDGSSHTSVYEKDKNWHISYD